MYKIFLSYGHADRVRASRVYSELLRLGQTVWMDEAPPDAGDTSFLGVPTGERHREVIAEAIRESATFLICDSPSWRESEYCRVTELGEALAHGCRLAVLADPSAEQPLRLDAIHSGDENLAELVAELEESVEPLLARVRLDELRRDGVGPDSWVKGLFRQPQGTRDAETVLAVAPGIDFPPVPEVLSAYAHQVLAWSRVRQRRTRRVVTTLVALLTALAAVAVAGGAFSVHDASRARALQRAATSMELAAESVMAEQPLAAQLAQSAWATDQNSQSRSALALATSSVRRTRIIPIAPVPSAPRIAGLADGGFAVIYSNRVRLLNPDGGLRSEVELLGKPARNSPIVVDDEGLLMVVPASGSSDATLLRVSTAEARVSETPMPTVTALGGMGPRVVVGDRAGNVGWLSSDGTTFEKRASVQSAVSALDAQGDVAVVLSQDSTVTAFSTRGNRWTKVWSTALPGVGPAVLVPSPQEPDQPDGTVWSSGSALMNAVPSLNRVVMCGGMTHVLRGTRAPYSGALHEAIDANGHFAGLATSALTTTYACDGEDLIGTGTLSSRLTTYRAGQTAPSGLVTSADRFRGSAVATTTDNRLVSVVTSGEIRVAGDLAAEQREAGASMFSVPLGARAVLAQDLVGDLWLVDFDKPSKNLGHLAIPATAALQGQDFALLAAGFRMVRVDRNGITGRWSFPAGWHTWTLTQGGETVLTATDRTITTMSTQDGRTLSTLNVPLAVGETLQNIETDGTAVYAQTSDQRLLRLDETGAVTATWTDPRSNRFQFAARAAGRQGVVVASRNGVVSLLDGQLKPIAERYVGAMGAYLQSGTVEDVVALALQRRAVVILDGSSLELRHDLESIPLLDGVSLSPDGSSLLMTQAYLRSTNGVIDPIDSIRLQSSLNHSWPALNTGQEDRAAGMMLIPLMPDAARPAKSVSSPGAISSPR